MAHLVMGWELDPGMEQAAAKRRLAEALLARGHRVTFVARDLADALTGLAGLPVECLPAPVVRNGSWTHTRTDCYSQWLGNAGCRVAGNLAPGVGAWRGLLEHLAADAAVLGFAPAAMLACRARAIPYAIQGNGFVCPPVSHAGFGLMRATMPETERLAEDATMLESINQVAREHGVPPLDHVSDLFRHARHTVLTTFPELDHFPRDDGAVYRGVWLPSSGKAQDWPPIKGLRVLACLDAVPGIEHVLRMLGESGLPVLIVCGGLSRQQRTAFETPACRFLDTLPDIQGLAREADLGIFHGHHLHTAAFLLAGKPTLQLPLYMEQLMFAQRVRASGAAELATLDRPEKIGQLFRRLMESSDYPRAAALFAERHAGFDENRQVGLATDALEVALLGS